MDLKIEKLNAKNYASWCIVMASLLKSKQLWTYIVDGSPEEKPPAVFARIEEAKAILYSTMESHQIIATGSCEDARDLWIKIKQNNQGAEENLRSNTLAEFLGLKIQKSENIIQFCGKYENLLSRLEGAGQTVDEATKLWVFRNSLGSYQKQIVSVWMLANKGGKISELITHLKFQYHLDKTESSPPETALYVEHKPQHENKNKPHSSKIPLTCTFCKKTGHIYKTCRKLAEKKNRQPNSSAPGPQAKKEKSYDFFQLYTELDNEILEEDDMANSFIWLVDSGATAHMSPHRELFVNYKSYDCDAEAPHAHAFRAHI